MTRIPGAVRVYSIFAFLLAASLLSPRVHAAPAPHSAESAPQVSVGVQMRSLTQKDDHQPTFAAAFLLWVSARDAQVQPDNIVLLNAAAHVKVVPAVARKDRDGVVHRLYRVSGDFYVGRQANANLLRGQRELDVLVALRGVAATLSADADAASALQTELADGSILPMRSFVTGETSAVFADSFRVGRGFGQQVLVARYTLPASAVSPKDALAAVLGRGNPWIAALSLAALGLAWFGLRRPRAHTRRMLLSLSAATVLAYELNRMALQAAAAHVSGRSMEAMLDLSNLLWWMAPALWLQVLLSTFAWRRIAQTSGYPVPGITRTLVPLVTAALCFTLALHYVWGYSVEAVWAASGVLSLVLGLALQGLILDAFAGIFLNLERPFKLLQWVSITEYQGREYEGQVIDINWRSTRLLTRANNIVSVPNSNLTRAMIVNYAEPTTPSRLELTLDLSAQVPIALARRLIVQGMLAAARDGRILAHPEPQVAVVETLAEGRTGYRGYFYVDLNLVAATVAVTDAMEAVIELLAASGIHGCAQVAQEQIGQEPGAGEQSADAPLPAQPMATASMPVVAAAPASLMEAEVALIQASWAKVEPIADTAAQLFYQRLFELDPELRRLFRTDAATQRRKLIGMLAIVVQGLGRMDRLMATVEELGLRHAGYGVQPRHFDTVGSALLWTLGQGLGPAFTPEVEQAWTRVYRFLAQAMTGMNKGPADVNIAL
ncbi:globin domain-containing protein [Pseudomonas sp. CGJS7]|uniref:globin domain-containing protein n=1 Tax=Pseudomonas sp. CGJS7 TaxID=3109348 RepID=UPI003009B00C